MAFERIGIGGFLKFDEKQALKGMNRARAGFARLKKGAGQVGAGLSQIGGGMRNMSLALAPLTAGLLFGIKKAADFEKKMSGVGAITRANASDMNRLTIEAKRQGVVSVFSASESAEAMEFLGRAGFNTTQIIDGLGGVMAAAAAEGIELAQSADIIARVVKGMGLEVTEASHIADVLALTSAKTNTSILALGESFKFGAPQAKTMGISVEETAAAFGALADAGLRGSIGGTSFSNMLIKLSKPSSKAKKLLKKFNIQLTDSSGKLRPLPDLIAQFSKKIDKIPNVVEKARIATELFGIRGAKAYSALALKGSKALRSLTADLKASSFGVGAAQEAADKRLDNFLGSLKLFGSSIEAVTIEFFGPLLTQFKDATQDITGGLNEVLFVIQKLKAVEDSFSLAAGEASNKQAQGIAKRLKLTKMLGDRQAAVAQAGVAALVREGVGQEKLTRQQKKSRSLGLIQNAKVSLAEAGFGEKRFRRQRLFLDGLEERAKAGKLTAQDEANIREKFVQGLARQVAGNKKLTDAQAAQSGNKIANMIAQQAQQAKIEAAANAMLAKEQQLNDIEEKHGTTARLIAEGVLDAIKEIKQAFDTVVAKMKVLGKQLEESIGKDRLRRFVKIGTIAVIVAGALAPLMIGFLGLAFVMKSVFGIFAGLGKVVFGFFNLFAGAAGMIKGAFVFLIKGGLTGALATAKAAVVGWLVAMKAAFVAGFAAIAPFILPVLAVMAILTAAFLLFRNEGESVGDTFRRLWGMIKAGADFVFQNAIKPFMDGFLTGFNAMTGGVAAMWDRFTSTIGAAWDSTVGMLAELVQDIKAEFVALFDEIFGSATVSATGTADVFSTMGEVYGTVVGFMANLWASWIGETIAFTIKFIGFLVKLLIKPFKTMIGVVRDVVGAFKALWAGDFMGFIAKIGSAITRILTLPFQIMMEGILKLMSALPTDVVSKFVDKGTIKAMEDFAKHGFADPPPIKQLILTETKGATAVESITGKRRGRRGAGREPRTRSERILEQLVKNADRRERVEKILGEQGLEVNRKNVLTARNALRVAAKNQRDEKEQQAKIADKELTANVAVTDDRETTVNTTLECDGEALAKSSAKHKQSVFERNGATNDPFLRGVVAQTGTRLRGNQKAG